MNYTDSYQLSSKLGYRKFKNFRYHDCVKVKSSSTFYFNTIYYKKNNNTPYYNVNCYIHKIIEISRLVIQTLIIISLLTNKYIVFQIYFHVLLRVLLSWSSSTNLDLMTPTLSLPVKGRESLQFLISKRSWVNTVQYVNTVSITICLNTARVVPLPDFSLCPQLFICLFDYDHT